jgi:heme/copper-type cytochrome/quinol oxidase subunit 2
MSRNQRIGLIVAAVAIAVIAYVIASPGGDDNGDNASTTTSRTQPDTGTNTAPAKPPATRIQIRANKVVGGPQDIKVKNGDSVDIVVSSDATNDLHLHGYDIEKTAEPGKPVHFKFKADAEGEFDLESHTFEHAGLDAQVATLIVEPR